MLQPGIKEAMKEFWAHIGRRTPSPIPHTHDRGFVNEALLLALARLKQTDPLIAGAGDLLAAAERFREVFAKIMVNCDSAFAGDSLRGPQPFVDLIRELAREAKTEAASVVAKAKAGG